MYEIKVLSNEEFDSLPESETRGSKIDDSLGFANRFTGKAYIRQTGVHELNKWLINHELEELESDESGHEDENGIRHKKGPKIFKDIILPFVTGGLSGGGGGGGGAITSILSSLFGGGSGTGTPKQDVQMGGSYTPTSGSYPATSGGFGGGGSPLNLFGNQGSYTAATQSLPGSGSYTPNITQGLGDLPDEIKQKLSGNYSGRLTF